ncbi:MAG TPA: tyrosine-type recombinase/integrase, partial [Solirubrobacteraceae bacterium]|nr:tyrosine-type recombinase/integrase [Solirubrobacteraceae bacterium]
AEESTARDRAIVALLLFTGLRLSEAAALRVADVRISARKGLVVVRSGLCRIRHSPDYAEARVMPSWCFG